MAAEQVRIVRTRWVPIDSVTAHPENARRSDTEKIRRSLEDHAQYAPIVVHEESGNVIVHNHVWAIAKELGHKRIYATFVSCSDTKAKAVLAVDNRTSDTAGYDEAALLRLLSGLEQDGLLTQGGFDGGELDDLRASLEELDPAPATELDDGSVPIRERKSITDMSDAYGAAVNRTVLLGYSSERYVWVVEQLAELADKLELDTNSDVVCKLIADATGTVAPANEG